MERIGKQRVYQTIDVKRINLSCNVESEDCSNSCSFPAIASPCSSLLINNATYDLFSSMFRCSYNIRLCTVYSVQLYPPYQQCNRWFIFFFVSMNIQHPTMYTVQCTVYNILLCTVYNILIYPPHHWFNRPWRWFISFYIRKFCIYNLISFSGIISLARFIKDPGGIQLIW